MEIQPSAFHRAVCSSLLWSKISVIKSNCDRLDRSTHTMKAQVLDEGALVVQGRLLEQHPAAGQLCGCQHQDLQPKELL